MSATSLMVALVLAYLGPIRMQTPNDSSIRRQPRSMRRRSTKACTAVRSRRCIGSCAALGRFENAVTSCAGRTTRSQNCSLQRRIRCGHGTSPSCVVRPNECSFGRTSFSTFQSLYGRLAGGRSRERSAGRRTDRANVPQAGHQTP